MQMVVERGLCQDIVKAKYVKNGTLSSIKHRIDDSPVWTDLLCVRHIYLKGRNLKFNNGKNTLVYPGTYSL
jgi:hypothetical protein